MNNREIELKDVEDLVMQISYFCNSSEDIRYVSIIVKNLSSQILEYLKIDFKDIEHLFVQEKEHHNYKTHTSKGSSDELHLELEKDKEKIKVLIQKIIIICSRANENKISREEFLKRTDSNCSAILKVIDSEHHELIQVKELLLHQKGVDKKRNKIIDEAIGN